MIPRAASRRRFDANSRSVGSRSSQLLFCFGNHPLQPRRLVRHARLTRSGSFHVNGAPVRAACLAQRICPKCPSPSCHRGYCPGIRFEPSPAVGEYSVSNLRCSAYGPPRPQPALEVRRMVRARIVAGFVARYARRCLADRVISA
jgi:hypothetical protein